METEERTRFEVLLEDIQRNVRILAEGQATLVERFDRFEVRFDVLEHRFDVLEQRFDVLERRFDGLEHRFEGFAGDTQRRLKRIEAHLKVNGEHRAAARSTPAKPAPRGRKKPS